MAAIYTHERKEGRVRFVIASGNATKPLDALKETLNNITMLVYFFVVVPRRFCVGLRGNHYISAMLRYVVEYHL